MNIGQNKVVSLSYELTVNGEVIQTVDNTNPMTFMVGRGYLLPKFEENITNLKVGDTFDFAISSEEAYGERNEDYTVELPKDAFMVEGEFDSEFIFPGNVIPMVDAEGNHLEGTVLRVEEAIVAVDFNHPLAGKGLAFKGEIVDVREATADELEHGHIHGDDHSSCGCDDEGCEGGGCGDKAEKEMGGCGCGCGCN
ncbi:FKBP-type peptidyl-prolyl cis-trans isomerase [Williamwhitmania taraxaci]|uniref:Peptidyl-prolyl cis-trans isomerase n=1 Tax=Williamwhitmania taraxaci TaxID=1640674 RepID=A0A1G6HI29_9BACT|nr:peptidylprolyl isomerase [Williamwhitmania taraxaci]SDB93919.1 FKBP-type peptidyl-prolyl cis-trans isomerase SlyD [Williamwhitmania taraxaci]